LAKRLEMIFQNAAGRRATISVDNVRDDVTEVDVQAVMDAVIAKNIFSTGGGDITAVDSARIVSTDITEIPVS
jgi:elongation factor P hydroxylase